MSVNCNTMRLIFATVNLVLLCNFTQTEMIILQWREMHTFFESVHKTAGLPKNFLTDENLCEAAKTSNLFKAEYEIYTPSEGVQLLSPIIQKFSESLQSEQVGTSELNLDNRQSFPLEDILFLADDEKRNIHPIRNDIIVIVDDITLPLSLFPCHLSISKIIYLSKGYRKYIDVYFIFGKIGTNSKPKLLAAMGESQLEEKSLQELPFNKILDEEEFKRKTIQFKRLTPTQYIWLCAVIQNHEIEGNRRNYKLIIKMWEYNQIFVSHLSETLSVSIPNFSTILYKVHDLNNESVNININRIVPVFDEEKTNSLLFFNYNEMNIPNFKYKYFHISSELLSYH